MIVAEPDLEWKSIYWVPQSGNVKGKDMWSGYLSTCRYKFEVPDAPVCGESHAFVLPSSDKTSSIVCPYNNFEATVSNRSGEIAMAREARGWNHDLVVDILKSHQELGQLTARVLAMLTGEDIGTVVVQQARQGGKSKKGKPPADTLLKPVKPNGKRGKLLKAIMDNGNTEELAHLERVMKANRNSVLSFLFMLNKDHGIGYALTGGSVVIHLPTEDPFNG